MSRNQRIGLVVAALLIAVVAFVVAQPGDDDNDSTSASNATQTQETTTTTTTGTETEAQTETEPPEPAEPPVTRINVKGGVIDGDVKSIKVEKGDTVRIVVTSDVDDEIHLHGYDIEREAGPGKPARFKFKANLEGAFELESHAAEDAGKEPLLAHLLVGPS
jgi:FtsP/CotA-like multicopper oxidase with cupredoxin domain